MRAVWEVFISTQKASSEGIHVVTESLEVKHKAGQGQEDALRPAETWSLIS